MQIELKKISKKAIPEAVQKAKRYRLINEPALAESICLDILAIDSNNQDAVITLLLSITDQFRDGVSPDRAKELLPLIQGEYCREYFTGVVWERAALAMLRSSPAKSRIAGYEALSVAMEHFEAAERMRPSGNDDAILRWNTCARVLTNGSAVQKRVEEEASPI